MQKKNLIEFEEKIVKDYEKGKIKNPVHLSGTGNEEELIDLFKEITDQDWVLSTHRNHYHALLKIKDPEFVRKAIKKSSMHINSTKHKFMTSSIVGGNLPIAVGIALALKLKGSKDKVWCFTGDMASQMGVFHECFKYAKGHKLPIKFIIENNELGVLTPTKEAWGTKAEYGSFDNIIEIKYRRFYPHHGIGKWVNF
jgi:TPP-dependent pyruvate/acetoin dehydrogenase alpha subunit